MTEEQKRDAKVMIENMKDGSLNFGNQTNNYNFSMDRERKNDIKWRRFDLKLIREKQKWLKIDPGLESQMREKLKHRMLVLIGPENVGKTTLAGYIALTYLNQKNPQSAVILETLSRTQKMTHPNWISDLKIDENGFVLATDVLGKGCLDWKYFLTSGKEEEWAAVEHALEEKDIYLIITVNETSSDRNNYENIKHVLFIDYPEEDSVRSFYISEIGRIRDEGRLTDQGLQIAESNQEEFLKYAKTLPQVHKYVENFLKNVILGRFKAADFFQDVHNLHYWYCKVLSDDFKTFCHVLALVLLEKASEQGVPIGLFYRFKMALTSQIRQQFVMEREARPKNPPLDAELLESSRTQYEYDGNGVQYITFREPKYAQLLWPELRSQSAQILLALTPILIRFAEKEPVHSDRAAGALGRMSSLDQDELLWYLLRRWALDKSWDKRMLIIPFMEGCYYNDLGGYYFENALKNLLALHPEIGVTVCSFYLLQMVDFIYIEECLKRLAKFWKTSILHDFEALGVRNEQSYSYHVEFNEFKFYKENECKSENNIIYSHPRKCRANFPKEMVVNLPATLLKWNIVAKDEHMDLENILENDVFNFLDVELSVNKSSGSNGGFDQFEYLNPRKKPNPLLIWKLFMDAIRPQLYVSEFVSAFILFYEETSIVFPGLFSMMFLHREGFSEWMVPPHENELPAEQREDLKKKAEKLANGTDAKDTEQGGLANSNAKKVDGNPVSANQTQNLAQESPSLQANPTENAKGHAATNSSSVQEKAVQPDSQKPVADAPNQKSDQSSGFKSEDDPDKIQGKKHEGKKGKQQNFQDSKEMAADLLQQLVTDPAFFRELVKLLEGVFADLEEPLPPSMARVYKRNFFKMLERMTAWSMPDYQWRDVVQELFVELMNSNNRQLREDIHHFLNFHGDFALPGHNYDRFASEVFKKQLLRPRGQAGK